MPVSISLLSILLLLIGSVLFYKANTTSAYYVAHLNSDIAGEGLLAADIAENGMIVPATWLGSTETRVFSTANLASVFYYFSHDMNWSMGISVFLYFLIVLFCMYLFLRTAGMSIANSLLAVSSAAFFTGSEEVLGVYAVFAGYYCSYLAVMFLIFALYAIYLREFYPAKESCRNGALLHADDKKHRAPAARMLCRRRARVLLCWFLGLILAFISGLEGLHVFLMAFLPLPAVEFLRLFVNLIHHCATTRKSKNAARKRGRGTAPDSINTLKTSASTANHANADLFRITKHRLHSGSLQIFIWSLCLMVTNYLTIRITSASSQQTTRNIRHAWEKFRSIVWPQMIEAISPDRSHALFLILLLLSLAGWAILLFSRRNDHKPAWACMALPVSVIVLVAAGTFTTADSSTRYYVVENFAGPVGVVLFVNWLATLTARRQNHPDALVVRGNEHTHQQQTVSASTAALSSGSRLTATLLSVLTVVVLLTYEALGLRQYQSTLLSSDNPTYEEYSRGISWMKENGYRLGYATFDYANLLAGISNYSVTIGCIGEVDNMRINGWLTDERWYPPYISAEEPAVYIISDARMEDFETFMDAHPDLAVINQDTFGNLHFIALPANDMHWDVRE